MTEVPSGLSRSEVAATAATIAAAQLGNGAICWFPGGQIDPWDHVEAAMGLSVAGWHAEAEAAYRWLRAAQNPDGSWYRSYRESRVDDHITEANFAAYLAVGLLHHTLSTGDDRLLDELWPTLVAALEFVLALQAPGGEIWWARSPDGVAAAESLLTGCASMFHSLRCALALARLRGETQPDWELAAGMLGHAVAEHPERFSPRDRYSMDWYYPVLGGALRGEAAAARIAESWETFVVPGLGVRCVNDHPWVTGAETCELILALCALGDHARAGQLFADVQHLRHEDGGYWTGYVYPADAACAPAAVAGSASVADGGRDAFWPVECTTWTAGVALLASAMLAGEPASTAVFGGAELPVDPRESAAACDHCRRVPGATR